jgi:hypothetical protein
MNRSGGSRRMATKPVSPCTSGTIRLTDTLMGASEPSSSVQAKRSFSGLRKRTPYGSGASSTTTAGSKASTAPSSATSQATAARASYRKRIESLIASGLIAGITPTSTRKGSPQKTLDFAFSKRVGVDVDEPKAGY